MSTPHNSAAKGDIAEKILICGDPLRAKFVAENYLTDVVNYNKVRNALGYTGKYKGHRVSVQGTGMGIPSTGIYVNELINEYGVKQIIRIGTTGAIQRDIPIGTLLFGQGACTNSSYNKQFGIHGDFAPICDFGLLKKGVEIADSLKVPYRVGNILASDAFYSKDSDALNMFIKMGVLGIDMETSALYMDALYYGVKALTIDTVSDNVLTGEETSADERESTFTNMMEVALELSTLED